MGEPLIVPWRILELLSFFQKVPQLRVKNSELYKEFLFFEQCTINIHVTYPRSCHTGCSARLLVVWRFCRWSSISVWPFGRWLAPLWSWEEAVSSHHSFRLPRLWTTEQHNVWTISHTNPQNGSVSVLSWRITTEPSSVFSPPSRQEEVEENEKRSQVTNQIWRNDSCKCFKMNVFEGLQDFNVAVAPNVFHENQTVIRIGALLKLFYDGTVTISIFVSQFPWGLTPCAHVCLASCSCLLSDPVLSVVCCLMVITYSVFRSFKFICAYPAFCL